MKPMEPMKLVNETMTALELSVRLKQRMPASAVIEWTCSRCDCGHIQRGVAFSLGNNLSRIWQSGDVIVFWSDGSYTVLYDRKEGDIGPDAEVTVVSWVYASEEGGDHGFHAPV